ncbi:hypothetical protein LC612_28580 [Nostoc sp. CHAB 5834]|nr:hypothetical protein [Nostoc sp. CHAB 5834]
MTNQSTMQKTDSPTQQLEEHKKRLSGLQERRTRVVVQLENERKAFEEAKAEAIKLFGTADLAELRRLYTERVEHNSMQVLEMGLALDEAERGISDIERQLSL